MRIYIVIFIVIAVVLYSLFRITKKHDTNIGNNLPSQDEVAKRALCLVALVKRSELEINYQTTNKLAANAKRGDKQKDETAKNYFEELNSKAISHLEKWVNQENLHRYLSPKEKTLFSKKLGTWDKQDIIDYSWRRESLGILLWSLSLVDEIPTYDKEFGELKLLGIVFKQPTSQFYSSIKLRPKEELSKAREIAEHWHWRSRTTQLTKAGKVTPPLGLTFEEIIQQSAEDGFRNGINSEPISKDFPVLNKPYRDLTEEEYNEITSITAERHFSLNWLNGFSKDWDNTPTGT